MAPTSLFRNKTSSITHVAGAQVVHSRTLLLLWLPGGSVNLLFRGPFFPCMHVKDKDALLAELEDVAKENADASALCHLLLVGFVLRRCDRS